MSGSLILQDKLNSISISPNSKLSPSQSGTHLTCLNNTNICGRTLNDTLYIDIKLNNFFIEVQKIIFPEKSKICDLLKDNLTENIIDNVMKNILSEIEKLKDQLIILKKEVSTPLKEKTNNININIINNNKPINFKERLKKNKQFSTKINNDICTDRFSLNPKRKIIKKKKEENFYNKNNNKNNDASNNIQLNNISNSKITVSNKENKKTLKKSVSLEIKMPIKIRKNKYFFYD